MASENELMERIGALEEKLDLLLDAIVVRQKDACEIAGISEKTARNMALRGDFDPLQKDGGRGNFITLGTVADLKPRRQKRKRKS